MSSPIGTYISLASIPPLIDMGLGQLTNLTLSAGEIQLVDTTGIHDPAQSAMAGSLGLGVVSCTFVYAIVLIERWQSQIDGTPKMIEVRFNDGAPGWAGSTWKGRGLVGLLSTQVGVGSSITCSVDIQQLEPWIFTATAQRRTPRDAISQEVDSTC
jgi:hypothetical protein